MGLFVILVQICNSLPFFIARQWRTTAIVMPHGAAPVQTAVASWMTHFSFTFHCQHAKQEKKLHEAGENAKLFKLFVTGSIVNLLLRFPCCPFLVAATHALYETCTNSFRRSLLRYSLKASSQAVVVVGLSYTLLLFFVSLPCYIPPSLISSPLFLCGICFLVDPFPVPNTSKAFLVSRSPSTPHSRGHRCFFSHHPLPNCLTLLHHLSHQTTPSSAFSSSLIPVEMERNFAVKSSNAKMPLVAKHQKRMKVTSSGYSLFFLLIYLQFLFSHDFFPSFFPLLFGMVMLSLCCHRGC